MIIAETLGRMARTRTMPIAVAMMRSMASTTVNFRIVCDGIVRNPLVRLSLPVLIEMDCGPARRAVGKPHL